jgi:hypothetical protein
MRVEVTVDLQMTMVMGAACAEALGGPPPSTETCASLGDSMNESFQSDPSSPIESVSCGFGSGSCRCQIEGAPMTFASEGPYTLQGTSFVDSDGDTLDYCVDGDRLRTSPPSTSGISGTIVLRRQ